MRERASRHAFWPQWPIIGWQEWREFGKSDITVRFQTTTSLNQDHNNDDTNGIHFFAFNLSWKF